MTSYKPYHETFIFFQSCLAMLSGSKVPVKDSAYFATLFSKSLVPSLDTNSILLLAN